MARYNSVHTCKDCGTFEVILKERTPYHEVDTELCAACLTVRAQLQCAKEDKLPFPKLIALLQKETAQRVQRAIRNEKLGEYTGTNKYARYSPTYWVDQLSQQV